MTKQTENHSASAASLKPRQARLLIIGVFAVCAALLVRTTVLSRRHSAASRAAEMHAELMARALQISRLKQLVAAHPGDMGLHRNLLNLYAQYHMDDQYIEELAVMAHASPENEQLQLALASTYGGLERWSDAATQYNAILHTWPRSEPAWEGLSLTYYRSGQFRAAMVAAKNARLLDPKSETARYAFDASSLEWAIQVNRMGDHQADIATAQEDLVKLLPTWPSKDEINYLLGHAYASMGRTDLAIQYLQEANRLHPSDPQISGALGHLLMKLQRSAEAETVVRAALAAHPDDAQMMELLGQLLQERSGAADRAEALRQLKAAAEKKPDNASYQSRFGAAALAAGDLAGARAAFEAAMRTDPGDPFPCQQMSVVLTRMGDRAGAARMAAQARQVEAANSDLKRLQALVSTNPQSIQPHLDLGDRYRALGLNASAVDQYRQALALDPHNARAAAGLRATALGSRP